ncbi:DUF2397 family protein [Streptomyces sp900116325]|uniref:DUF2397 family protein n=1 Tax=Streptomyces sp. 900116325 TaxID=3154295 RepID=UPI00339DF754
MSRCPCSRDASPPCGQRACLHGSTPADLELHEVEVETFLAYKDRLIQYLERFIQNHITLGGRIALLIGKMGEQGRTGPLLSLAAAREAADAAPEDSAHTEAAARRGAPRDGPDSPSGSFGGGARVAGQAAAWTGARSDSTTARSGAAAERATGGHSDRSAGFREPARWFAHAPDDETRHRLSRVAFGLYSSRHLTVDADTFAARSADPEPASTSWADARPLRISPQLRRTGSYERRGKPRKVADRGEAKRRLTEIAARQAEQSAKARARLATGGPVRLFWVSWLCSVGGLIDDGGQLGRAPVAWPTAGGCSWSGEWWRRGRDARMTLQPRVSLSGTKKWASDLWVSSLRDSGRVSDDPPRRVCRHP